MEVVRTSETPVYSETVRRYIAEGYNLKLQVVHPLQVQRHKKFHGPPLTGSSFASTSEVRTSVILEWLKLRD
jgi:hypothetical protein